MGSPFGPGRRCAVLGRPIRHSLSPLLHRAAYDLLGLDWRYDAFEVGEDGLAEVVRGLDGSWRGLSLTMPLKRAVLPLLDELAGVAAVAGAANTVLLDGGRRVGHNTDVPGAAAALQEREVGPVRTAVVVGGGATAASVLLALADLGCREASLLVREPSRAAPAVAAVRRHASPPELAVGALAGAEPRPVDLLVSTLPGTAQDEDLATLVPAAAAVFDVSYDPWPTRLAAAAAPRGIPVVSGFDLLLHQAVLQVALMTGLPPVPVNALRPSLPTA